MQVDSTFSRFIASTQSHLGFDPRDQQLAAAQKLLGRVIAEMATGEGKTLTLAAAASLLARKHQSVYIATANDYLAQRDAQWMQPIYRDQGLSASFVTSQSTPSQRTDAYRSPIVYATIREFGFDYLRAALAKRNGDAGIGSIRLDALIVDEADSVLIDEARTPLIITAPLAQKDPAMESCYRWAAEIAASFVDGQDYVRVDPGEAVALTDRGNQRVLHLKMPSEMKTLSMTDILHSLEQAIWVSQTMQAERDYVVRDNRVAIVNEFTGRASDKRSFATGIQQAIEAQQGLPISPPSQPVARITVQDFADKFKHVCGTTATAKESRQEFKQVYDVAVVDIPLHQPSQRRMLQPQFFSDQESKWQAIADETKSMIAKGRAVLIGTRSIPQSLSLAKVLDAQSIPHVVLNALNHQHESEIVAKAGQVGQVTVATNMAGRGTDIQLSQEVHTTGGLHVIVSEPHSESRIDRQLIGRCARQGNPGSTRLYASSTDQLFSDQVAVSKVTEKRIAKAQTARTQQHRLQRSRLMSHETAMATALKKLGLDPHLDPC